MYERKVIPDGPAPARIAFVGEAPGCLLPDQYVSVGDSIPELINAQDGHFPEGVVETHSGYYNGAAYAISALGHTCNVTSDHRVWITPYAHSWTNHSRRVVSGAPEWVPANSLTKNMFLTIPKRFLPIQDNTLPVIDITDHEVSFATALVFGLFVGGGSVATRGGFVRWHLSEGYKEKYVRVVVDWIKALGCTVRVKKKRKTFTVSAYSTKLASFFSSAFYSQPEGLRGHDIDKQMPKFVWSWPAWAISTLLFGWHEADSKHQVKINKGYTITTVSSRAFAGGVDLFTRLGVLPTVSHNPPRGKGRQPIHHITVGNSLAKRLDWPLPYHDKKSRVLYNEDTINFYVPLTKAERFMYTGPVCDFTTASGTYDVPFRVHNSNEVSEGRGFIGPSGQLLWELVGRAGFSRDDVWVTNAMLCKPKPIQLSSGARIPVLKVMATAAACCRRRLVEELLAVQPAVVMPLGNWALWALSDIASAKVYAYRGARLDVDMELLRDLIAEGKTRAPMKKVVYGK